MASHSPRVWLAHDPSVWKRYSLLVAASIIVLVSAICFLVKRNEDMRTPIAQSKKIPSELYVDRAMKFSMLVPPGWGRSQGSGPVNHYRVLFLTINSRGIDQLVIANPDGPHTPDTIYEGLPCDILYCEFSYAGGPPGIRSERSAAHQAFTSFANVLRRTEYVQHAPIKVINFEREGCAYRILIISKGTVSDADHDKAMIHTLQFEDY
jgi:hypothetical protein